MKTTRLPFLLVLLFAATARVDAQGYSIDRAVIASGGGTSVGGNYSLSGTIGQPDASPQLQGGGFSLEGGFWPGLLVPSTGAAPALLIQLTGNDVRILWTPDTPGFLLEQTDSLAAPEWKTAPPGNPASIPHDGVTRFYRLRKP